MNKNIIVTIMVEKYPLADIEKLQEDIEKVVEDYERKRINIQIRDEPLLPPQVQ